MVIQVASFKQTPTLLRDVRVWRIAGQIFFAAALIWLGSTLWHNLTLNLQKAGIQVSLNFIQSQASFDIGERIVQYNPTDSFGWALIVGFVNTLRVSLIGIVLATLLGLVVGLARLSGNWLIERLAQLYVEVFRNTPLLLQLFFWYFAGFANLPPIDANTPSSSLLYITNRGLAIPWFSPTSGTILWLSLLAIATLASAWLWRWRLQRRLEQGEPAQLWLWSGGAIALGIVASLIITRTFPFTLNTPYLQGTELAGGLQLSPEFSALLMGLTFFIASFIAEIVRAGIQSVPRGQWEAAKALGLNPGAVLSQVVLPQALRVIVPPLTSQYLNLAKGSSLAIAIGYPDIYFVANTIFNQSGRAVEVMLILMLSYLGVSLIISLLMNLLNQKLQIQER